MEPHHLLTEMSQFLDVESIPFVASIWRIFLARDSENFDMRVGDPNLGCERFDKL